MDQDKIYPLQLKSVFFVLFFTAIRIRLLTFWKSIGVEGNRVFVKRWGCFKHKPNSKYTLRVIAGKTCYPDCTAFHLCAALTTEPNIWFDRCTSAAFECGGFPFLNHSFMNQHPSVETRPGSSLYAWKMPCSKEAECTYEFMHNVP